jgi:hypothetical protein
MMTNAYKILVVKHEPAILSEKFSGIFISFTVLPLATL